LKSFLEEQRRERKTIGLVPTMGALHDGHVALIEASKAQNQLSVCSIYVNPTQFNNAVDLQKYPRTFESDSALLEEIGCDVIFCPDNEEMYDKPSKLTFDFGFLDKVMEGEFRPGHFSGVALVVAKLFNIVEPDQAYFGQKDWQQFAVIKQLTEELCFGLKLNSVPTLRESDGLAMSSRNLRLNEKQRPQATVFYKALFAAKSMFRGGESILNVKNSVRKIVETEPEVRLEYFEVTDSKNLTAIGNVQESDKPIMCIAGYVGEIRLIDNMFLD
ncbi:MAG TPA: pantoate--beta-alanine ligase, partial [Chryseolinea sp.]|nr:pantoate--beta-alanine ligase [Chryseolinea sp.]